MRDTADACAQPPFAGERWRDADGRLWQEIVLAALAEDDRFLAVAA
jgi:twitching motility protein PilI